MSEEEKLKELVEKLELIDSRPFFLLAEMHVYVDLEKEHQRLLLEKL